MPGINDIAAKLKTAQPKPQLVKKPAVKKPVLVPAKKKSHGGKVSPGKHGGKMAALKPKILAMQKAGKSLSKIANELGLSDSYVWVIARDYKYDREATAARRKAEAAARGSKKKNGKSSGKSNEQKPPKKSK